MKPCPNNMCKSDPVLRAGDFLYVQCLSCGMEGPAGCTKNDAISSWDNLPRALRWTSEPPVTDGWILYEFEQEGTDPGERGVTRWAKHAEWLWKTYGKRIRFCGPLVIEEER